MTFKEVQDRVMARFNLTSDDARDRIKNHINERLRRAQTSCSMGRVRRGTVITNTVDGVNTITPIGVIKHITTSIPAQRVILVERSPDQLRNLDIGNEQTGVPRKFAITNIHPDGFTMQLSPVPGDVYAVHIDGILVGGDMVEDEEIPGLPEDFHDLLVFGALADEYDKTDDDQSEKFKREYKDRLKDLRYFVAKAVYLRRVQGGGTAYWWLHGSAWVNA